MWGIHWFLAHILPIFSLSRTKKPAPETGKQMKAFILCKWGQLVVFTYSCYPEALKISINLKKYFDVTKSSTFLCLMHSNVSHRSMLNKTIWGPCFQAVPWDINTDILPERWLLDEYIKVRCSSSRIYTLPHARAVPQLDHTWMTLWRGKLALIPPQIRYCTIVRRRHS